MILYNVTVSIDADVRDEWLQWMKTVHIPEVMATGLFSNSRIARILAEEEGGFAYSIQYLCADMETFELYEREHAPRLREAHSRKYNGRFAAFRTLLRIEHEHEHAR